MSAPTTWRPSLGAWIDDGGGTQFRVWAPDARAVSLVLEGGGAPRPLAPEGTSGYFAGVFADLTAGTEYRYRLDDGPPVPRSRLTLPAAWRPRTVVRRGSPRLQLERHRLVGHRRRTSSVIYELHVGAFTARGHVCRRGRSTRVARPPWRHRDRADAGGRLSRAAGTGDTTASRCLRRRAATGRPTTCVGWSTAPTALGLAVDPRRRLQPPRPRRELLAGLQPALLHRPASHAVGLLPQSSISRTAVTCGHFSSRTRLTGSTSSASMASASMRRTP